jgi:hypothetical protein
MAKIDQLKSWFDLQVSPASQFWGKGLIAQFFFPTDKSDLDLHDRWVLWSLVAHLRHSLQRERVELAIIGHADHRGDSTYNQKLGLRRAKTIAGELNGLLRSEPNFSAYSGLALASSAGERYAMQGTRDARALAQDRRVDVRSSSARYVLPELPLLELKPQLARLVYREFRKINHTYHGPGGQGKDTFDEGIEALVELLVDLIEDAKVPGNERVDKRQYRYFDATYRVNRVEIHTHHFYKSGWGYELETLETTVKYTWGVPRSIVEVHHLDTWDLLTKKGSRRHTTQLSREKADKDSFFFPPPRPW